TSVRRVPYNKEFVPFLVLFYKKGISSVPCSLKKNKELVLLSFLLKKERVPF
ncbi:Uncharacterized protein FWK35_00029613, partial [Aphis craccivora]